MNQSDTQKQVKPSLQYRPEIDGLRAIAVLLVLLFHAGITFIPGGFVGVDVFFVISGYLITKIIRGEVQKTGTISFKKFYGKRARRLLPALFATLIGTSVAAALLLSPVYLVQYFESLVYSAASLSNIYFWSQSGYFDIDSSFKPLLHTWSLSVEEQFYLVWPVLLLLILKKASARNAPIWIAAISVLSLAANAIAYLPPIESAGWITAITANAKSSIYLLTPFRVFEFGIGALLTWCAPITRPKISLILSIAGVALITASAVLFNESLIFPSLYALVPCFGTAMVILAGTNSVAGRAIGSKPLVAVGLMSYSLYLVHWPIIVFLKNYTQLSEIVQVITAISLSMVLGYLQFRLIEKPFRTASEKSNKAKRSYNATVVLASLGFITMGSVLSWHYKGEEIPDDRKAILNSNKGCYVVNQENCNMAAEKQILTIGNSHELDAYNIMKTLLGERTDVNVMSFGTNYNCDFALVDGKIENLQDHPYMQCKERVALLNSDEFLDKFDYIVFSAHRPLTWGAKMIKITEHLKSRNPRLKIIFMSGYIGIRPNRCDDLSARFGTFDVCKSPEYVDYFADTENTEIAKLPLAQKDFLYIDKVAMLCRDRKLENCEVEAYGQPVFTDGDHLTLAFSKMIGEKMKVYYRKELHDMGL